MGSVHENWVSTSEGQSNFIQTVTLQGRIHHILGGFQAAPGIQQAFLSVYIHDMDFDVQFELQCQNLAAVNRTFLKYLESMLNQKSVRVQRFMSLRELARDNAPTERYKMVLHAAKGTANETYIPAMGCLALDPLRPGNEDGMITKQDILVRIRGRANSN